MNHFRISESRSSAIKYHSGVKPCRVTETRARHSPQKQYRLGGIQRIFYGWKTRNRQPILADSNIRAAVGKLIHTSPQSHDREQARSETVDTRLRLEPREMVQKGLVEHPHTSHYLVFARMSNDVSHDSGSRCWCASYHPCACVFDLSSTLHLALFTVSLIFYFILLIFHFLFHVGRFGDKSPVRFRE